MAILCLNPYSLVKDTASILTTNVLLPFTSSRQVDKMIVPLWACHYALMGFSKGPNEGVKGP